MSFFGTSNKISELPRHITKVSCQGLDLYFESDTAIYQTENYQLFIIGKIEFDEHSLNIEQELENAVGTFTYVLCFQDSILIGTDNMGFYPLYYSDFNGFSFANFIPHLKHRMAKPEINWNSWNELLNGGDILGNKTTIKNIYRLRQGEKLCYKNEKFSAIAFTVYKPTSFVDKNVYIEENNALLLKGMTLLSKGTKNNVIPLTGGHDSRRIALCASELGIDYNAVTQETNVLKGFDVDTFIAEKLTDILGIKEHEKLAMPSIAKMQYHKVYKDYWCGFESAQHEWAANISKSLKPKSLIFDGIIGDVTVNNHYFFENPQRIAGHKNIHHLASSLLTNVNISLKKQLLDNSLLNATIDELSLVPNDYNQLTLFKIFNHTRRNIGHWFTLFLHEGHDVALPYAYLPFFNQSLSLDPSQRIEALYQYECMRERNKFVAEIDSTRSGHNEHYWEKAGAKKVRQTAIEYKNGVNIVNKAVFSNLDLNIKEFVFNNIIYPICPKQMTAKRAWKYIPLQRLAMFLQWLDCDEGHLPILYKGNPPFLEKFFVD